MLVLGERLLGFLECSSLVCWQEVDGPLSQAVEDAAACHLPAALVACQEVCMTPGRNLVRGEWGVGARGTAGGRVRAGPNNSLVEHSVEGTGVHRGACPFVAAAAASSAFVYSMKCEHRANYRGAPLVCLFHILLEQQEATVRAAYIFITKQLNSPPPSAGGQQLHHATNELEKPQPKAHKSCSKPATPINHYPCPMHIQLTQALTALISPFAAYTNHSVTALTFCSTNWYSCSFTGRSGFSLSGTKPSGASTL